ncbi:MAG TPA: extracellular solute-binding protein [Stackebrandtia sp.]|uniref:ABC transporter substrate-binding protein n=1 Tax=Stackebrandtia sp. TaxID=2023065 RepID=UPI002D31AEA6|nr:extracellular solute-binding protein [Stackebrandtia sp.]HZE40644.1 extracellular solute-binding protein [Stackebrandtia sp.]
MTPPLPSDPLPRRTLLRLAGLTGVAGATAGLASCAGAPGGGDSGDFTVYWNAGHGYAAYKDVIDTFESDHGITVNLQKFQWDDLRTQLLSDMQSGHAPDLVETPGGWVREFAVSGDALSLESYIADDGEDMGYPKDWQERTRKHNAYHGKTYGIQLHLTCSLLFYNRALFKKANVRPPTTWDELLDVAKKLTSGDVHGIALNQDYTYSWPWMLQNGVRYFDPDGKDFLHPHDAAIEALAFQRDLVHRHKVSPVPTPGTDYSGPQKLLSAGRAAMILTGPWDLGPIAESSPDLDLGIAPALKGKQRSTLQAGSNMFIPRKAPHPDLAWDLIKRLTTLKVERAATKETGMLMPRLSWAKGAQVRDDPKAKPFADAFGYAVDYGDDVSLTGKSGDINDLYKKLYQSVVIDDKAPDAAVKSFVSAAGDLVRG